jgi:hypothetical protein
MTIPESQYVDLLIKKLDGVAKTDTATNKSPSNENIPSPELNRGDTVWTQANQIPSNAIATANLIASHINSTAVQCVADTTTVPIGGIYPTWLTNITEWIPPEFGSTYSVQAYIGPPNAANIVATGTFISSAGEAGVGEFFFDYQAGLLNFIGETIPTQLTAGNIVYITGYSYIGLSGVTNLPNNTNIGNIVIANTSIAANNANLIVFSSNTGVGIPVGNTAQRPSNPPIGTTRFNSSLDSIETWNGTTWITGGGNTIVPGAIVDQQIIPTGADSYTLLQNSTSSGVMVSINGVNQLPDVAYNVTGNVITFTQTPQPTDIIDIRFITYLTTVSMLTNISGNSSVIVDNNGTIQFTTANISTASMNNSSFNVVGNISTNKLLISTPVPYANLTAVSGARAFINNGNLVATNNFGARVSGGGSNTVPVWSDGVNWYIG